MTVKECLFKAHHGVHITDDDEDFLQEMRELGGRPFKLRATDTFSVSKQDFAAFERSLDYIPDYDKPLPNSSGLGGPQGKRCTYDGCQFDSMWEYAFYRYHKEIKGSVITRNETEYIPYIDENGKNRKFYYDFVVDGMPYEVKGIMRPTDMAKMQATGGQVTFVTKVEMQPILKELSQRYPNWKNDCILN
jgi:hypothetical protein